MYDMVAWSNSRREVLQTLVTLRDLAAAAAGLTVLRHRNQIAKLMAMAHSQTFVS